MASTSSGNLTTLKAVNPHSNKQRGKEAGCSWKKGIYTNLHPHIKLNRVNRRVRVCDGGTEATKFAPQHCYIRERGITRISGRMCTPECESERARVRRKCGNRVTATTFHTLPSPQKYAAPVSCQTRYRSQQRGAWRCSFWNSATEMRLHIQTSQIQLYCRAAVWGIRLMTKGLFSKKLRKVWAELGESCHLASSLLPRGRGVSLWFWVKGTNKRPQATPQTMLISQCITSPIDAEHVLAVVCQELASFSPP